jgi:hypothetical protein
MALAMTNNTHKAKFTPKCDFSNMNETFQFLECECEDPW